MYMQKFRIRSSPLLGWGRKNRNLVGRQERKKKQDSVNVFHSHNYRPVGLLPFACVWVGRYILFGRYRVI